MPPKQGYTEDDRRPVEEWIALVAAYRAHCILSCVAQGDSKGDAYDQMRAFERRQLAAFRERRMAATG